MKLTKELRQKLIGKITNSDDFRESKITIDELNQIIDEELLLLKLEKDGNPIIHKKFKTFLKHSSKELSKIVKYKLYRVSVSYFEEKLPKSQSIGGCTSYIVSAITTKNANKIGLNKFNKEYSFDDIETVNITTKSKKIKLPNFVKLTDEGILEL